MHVLMLGATGFTGRALMRCLGGARPAVEITAVSRKATAVPGARRVLTGHYADLFRAAAARRSLAGVDAVVHLADGLSILQKREHAADAALAGRLLAAARSLAVAVRDARVPLLVCVSSIKAIADEDDDRVLTETSEPRGTTAYGRAKRELEEVMAQALEGSQTRLVVVRNPVMYGEESTGSLHRLLKLADTPLPLPLGGLDNRRSVLAVQNFASALATIVAAAPRGPRGVFHVHDGRAPSTTEIVATLRSALGRPARLFTPVPTLARAAQKVPMIAPIARRLYDSLELSDAHFRRSFAWTPVVDTPTALMDMVRSFLRGARTG